jgi:DNA-binding NtrC family response regulator/tetratricopeptide (TPR) repeat protein
MTKTTRTTPTDTLREAERLWRQLRPRSAAAAASAGLRRGSLEPALEAALRLARSRALWATGGLRLAHAELDKAAVAAGSGPLRAQVERMRAFFSWKAQDHGRARERLEAAWRHLGEGASREDRLRLLEIEAGLLRDRGAFEDALRVQTERLSLATAAGLLEAEAAARSERGDLLSALGRWAPAREELERAVELTQGAADLQVATVAAVRRAALDLAAGGLRAARERLERVRESLTAHQEDPGALGETLIVIADLELMEGRLPLAEGLAAEALRLFGVAQDRAGECRARLRRSLALSGLGRHAEAEREARRALRTIAPERHDLLALAGLVLGRALLGRNPSGALDAFEHAQRSRGPRPGWGLVARLGSAIARGAAEGDPEIEATVAGLEAWGDQRLIVLSRAALEATTPAATLAADPAVAETGAERRGGAPRFAGIVGRCAALERLFAEMESAAAADIPVHIYGETGTGKERVARALHQRSRRAQGRFVAVNASSLSDELFESEMFGHVRGAFTGALADRRGYVAEADAGTLFLDEVADLSLRAQAKLLRFLAESEYRRVGESETRRANVRIVTAANVSLDQRVADGRFRADLLYRLTIHTVALPPLRERGDDVVLLARHFVREAAEAEGRRPPELTPELLRALRGYAWPGNVRELQGEMRRLVCVAGDGPLRREQLSPRCVQPAAPPRGCLKQAMLHHERDVLVRSLESHGGNRSRAAVSLGITRQALAAKIRRLGIG